MRRGRSGGWLIEEKTNVIFCLMQNLDFTYIYTAHNIKAKRERGISGEERG